MLHEIPLLYLFLFLLFLLAISAFFSGSETSMMSLNRYRLRHLVKQENRKAVRAQQLLEKPDRLIGVILIGNNLANILASSVTTLIALRLYGDAGVAIGAGLLTFVVLIFCEVAPKTLAALNPEPFAFAVSGILKVLLIVLYPIVYTVNLIANKVLISLGHTQDGRGPIDLSTDELRTVLNEAGSLISDRHQQMLLSILDLENVKVEDIMIPRNEVVGIDINDEWEDILSLLTSSQHTRLPLYRDNLDAIIGVVHIRKILHQLEKLTPEEGRNAIIAVAREAYFIPEGTPLNVQLLQFQRRKRRMGLVIDEYGDILGLATLEDLLEEIVGEFTTDKADNIDEIFPQKDGSYLVDGGVDIKDLNQTLDVELPTDGPRTLSGLIIEILETIPEANISVLIDGYPIEILHTKDNMIKKARIQPNLRAKIISKRNRYSVPS